MARYSERGILDALRARGVRGVRQVRFRQNRSTILSVTGGGRTLNLHAAFADAPARILDALATYLAGERLPPYRARAALRTLREWQPLLKQMRLARRRAARQRAARRTGRRQKRNANAGPPAPGPCCGTDAQQRYLRALYAHYNRTRFRNRLPRDLAVRLSSRMRSRYGQARLYRHANGRRAAIDIALHADLMLRENDRERHDTLLHEMAHIEAWLLHRDAGHGSAWKRIAVRVGCAPTACGHRRIRQRTLGAPPTGRVPDDVGRAA